VKRLFALAATSWLALALGCASAAETPPASPHAEHGHHAMAPTAGAGDDALAEVARVHGGAGPWAVLGYRMGEHARTRLGLPRHSFDLEVIHRSPREVQYSCMADGAAAATGASLGKLNLTLEPAEAAAVETLFRKRSTGQTLVLRPAPAFVTRFKDVPRAELGAKGCEVMTLSDAELFAEVPPAR
jgi:formylmethanofuran dehydrogenase subunit E